MAIVMSPAVNPPSFRTGVDSRGICYWDDPEGWGGEGGGRGVQDGAHMYTHGRFMSMCGRNHHNIVK